MNYLDKKERREEKQVQRHRFRSQEWGEEASRNHEKVEPERWSSQNAALDELSVVMSDYKALLRVRGLPR